MFKEIYVIRDSVSGECGDLMTMANDAVVTRALKDFVSQFKESSPETVARVRDSAVYCVGKLSYDLDGMPVIESCPPRLICRLDSFLEV